MGFADKIVELSEFLNFEIHFQSVIGAEGEVGGHCRQNLAGLPQLHFHDILLVVGNEGGNADENENEACISRGVPSSMNRVMELQGS